MKKFLITISPLCVVLFVLMWISWGLKGALAFFSVVFFLVAGAILFSKWVEFVDNYISALLWKIITGHWRYKIESFEIKERTR